MPANPAALPLRFHEATMLLPNIICLEFRDESCKKGEFVELGSPDASAPNSIVSRTNPYSSQTETAIVCGGGKTHLKFFDQLVTNFLDRDAAKAVGDWSITGGYAITAVKYKNHPYDAGDASPPGGQFSRVVCYKHFLYLVLSANLANGSYTIGLPAGLGLDDIDFDFDDKTTRCIGLHMNQVGFRPGDDYKEARFSDWVPGLPTEGAVQLPSGQRGYIIDPAGTVFAGCTVTEVLSPTSIETTSAYADQDTTYHRWFEGQLRYTSMEYAPAKAVSVSNANPCVIGYDNDTLDYTISNGDIVALTGFSGVSFSDKVFVQVANHDAEAHTFEIDANTASAGAWVPETYLPDHDGLIHKTFLAHRGGSTYVYKITFGTWTPVVTGLFRVWLPGIGVSDEFRIDPSIWYQIAKAHFGGVHNQRLGCAIEGALGYTRPRCFADVDSPVYASNLPGLFVNELPIADGITASNGSISPWITGTRVTGWAGGHMDAGDWDTFIYVHFESMHRLLTFGYELANASMRDLHFGIQKSSALLDPVLYAGTDDLSDVIHEVLWHVDTYRRTQWANGAVYSGFAPAGNALHRSSQIGPAPSWFNAGADPNRCYAPDHVSNFLYAIVAAKLAIIFDAEGLTTLAATWLQSAEKAYEFAEAIYVDFNGDAADATFENFFGFSAVGAHEAHYITTLNLKANAGYSDPTYATNIGKLQASDPPTAGVTYKIADVWRFGAAACLFRATGESYYGNIVGSSAKTSSYENNVVGFAVSSGYYVCMLEYFLATQEKNETVAGQYASTMNGSSLRAGIADFNQGAIGYRYPGASTASYVGSSPGGATLLAQWHLYLDDPKYLEVMRAHQAYVLGCNQYGSCFTIGLGHRNPTEPLHEDKLRSGALQGPYGTTFYMASEHMITLGITQNLGSDSPLNFTVQYPTGDYEATFGTKRLYEPTRYSRPLYEHTIENRFVIYHMEYTFHECAARLFLEALWLHGHDGNTQQTQSPARIRLRMNSAAA